MYAHCLVEGIAIQIEEQSIDPYLKGMGFEIKSYWIEPDEEDFCDWDWARQEEWVDSFQPNPSEGFVIVAKFIGEDGDLAVWEVKPLTEFAKRLWELAEEFEQKRKVEEVTG